MTAPQGIQKRSLSLDGLRGLAILLVVLSHLSAGRLPLGGMVGVTLFFVLSGYLITTVLLAELRQSGRIDLRAFFVRRALRLGPALLVLLACCPLVLFCLNRSKLGWALLEASVAALLYAGDFLRASGNPMVVLGHTWSLAVEEQFYLIWPFVVIRLTRLGRRTPANLVACMALAFVAWRLLASWTFGFDRVYFAPDTNAFALLLGCTLAYARPRGIGRVVRTWTTISLILLILLAALPCQNTSAYYPALKFGAVAAGVLAVIVVAGADSIRWILTIRPMRFFGRISYGLYLWHEVILLSIPTNASQTGRAVAVLAAVGMSTISWYAIEKRALKLKGKFVRDRVIDVRLTALDEQLAAGQSARTLPGREPGTVFNS